MKYSIPSTHNCQPYIGKYLILKKTQLMYFKSKETYLRLQNPAMILNIKDILDCNRIIETNEEFIKKNKIQKNMYHFYILYNPNTSNKSLTESMQSKINSHRAI